MKSSRLLALLAFGPTSEILYAGLDDRYKRYMPTYVTWRDAIQECLTVAAKAVIWAA